MDKAKKKQVLHQRRRRRVRKRIAGTPDRPRLSVRRTNKHIYAQVIDDVHGRTLVACSTLSPQLRGGVEGTGTVEGARRVGDAIGRKCLEQGIAAIVFDRGGRRYHGRVKALAEAAREQFRQAGAEGF